MESYFEKHGLNLSEEKYKFNHTFLIEQSNIPYRLMKKTIESFKTENKKQETCKNICQEFSDIASREKTDDTFNNIVMFGSVGTGKTHLAVAIVKKCIDNLVPARIMTVNEIVSLVRSTWRGGEKTELQIINELSELSVLAIDEIGATLETETEKNIISQIIDKRYSGMKKTIFITNLSKKGLEDCLGERSIDRIFSESKTLVFDWESKR